MDPAPAQSKRRPMLPRWLPEMALIVVSVALGFGAAQYGEYRGDRQLGVRILVGLEAELEQNLASLEPMVPFHREWVQTLSRAGGAATESGLDVWFATRPEIPDPPGTPFAYLGRSAWDAAIAGGSIRLLDYDVTAALSEVYRAQELLSDNINRLAAGPLSQTSTFDPGARQASVRLLWLTLADIYAAEELLLRRYRQHLPLIREAVERGGSTPQIIAPTFGLTSAVKLTRR